MGKLGSLAVVLVLAGLAAASAPASAQVKFRFAHTISLGDAQTLATEEFAKKVAQKTGNAIQIELFPAGQLGNDPRVMEGVKLGTIDMGMTGNPFFTSFAPELNVFDLPYLFRDFDHVYKVLDGPIGAEMRRHLERHGFKALGGLEIGFRNVTNSKRQVKGPEDLRGLKLRTTPNPAHLQAFRLLGANPVPMPFTEVYLALKTGAVDGQENPIAHIYSSKFHEVQKFLSLTYHAYTTNVVVMNLKKYQELKPEHQTAMQEALQEATVWERALNRKMDVEALAKMKEAGVQVEENPDRAALRKVVADATAEEYVKKFGKDVLGRIQNTR
jgi:tripartite ATP-independent transporter DctP family solute receptor